MKPITAATDAAWRSRIKAGPTRPVARVTIQDVKMRLAPYNTEDAPGGDYDRERPQVGHFASILFGQEGDIRELRNVRRVSWARSVDQDVAECTISVLNVDVVPIGNLSETNPNDFELPGLFTFSRGETNAIASARWGYNQETGWSTAIAPDRLIKTYEGYGADNTLPPGDDPNMYQSGVWLVDDVTYNANGDIEIKCRDVGRLLMDAISFPPVVPRDAYPMEWYEIHNEEVPGRDCLGGSWKRPAAAARSSNDLYVGLGIVDRPTYVEAGGNVQGHTDRDAITGGSATHWLSTGQDDPEEFVWWQEDLDSPVNMTGVRIHTKGGPFKVYVSLQKTDGTWYGRKKIPYNHSATESTAGVNIQADVPFVKSEIADRGLPFDIVLRRRYANVAKVRITITRLRRDGPSQNYQWRAGLRDVQLYTGTYSSLSFGLGTKLKAVGNYTDFTDIVKWCCAWAGLYWPQEDQENWIRYSPDGTKVAYTYGTFDAALPRGRAWGSFQDTGTAGVAKLTADNFDKQPLLDCILAGTPVKVAEGRYEPIENLKLGDAVANRPGFGRVLGRKATPVATLVSVVIDGEEIVTTPGHLFETETGWIRADELKSGHTVRTHLPPLRSGVPRTQERPLVRNAMPSQIVRGVRSFFRGHRHSLRIEEDLLRSLQETGGGSFTDPTTGLHLPILRQELPRGGWEEVLLPGLQRVRKNDTASDTMRGLWEVVPPQSVDATRLFDGVSIPRRNLVDRTAHAWRPLTGAVRAVARSGSRLASGVLGLAAGHLRGNLPLASRPCASAEHDDGGSGRARASHFDQGGEGRAEGSLAHYSRVDSVQVHRLGDPEWPRFCGPDGQAWVYDITVSGDPSFVVGKGEFVVHNCILFIKNITGFSFWFDECGGVVWRMPNIYQRGNYLSRNHKQPRRGPARTLSTVVIDENVTLLSYSTVLSSKNLREQVFVGDSNGKYGIAIKGYQPYDVGFRRVAGWTDENFQSNREVTVAADMVAAQQMFNWRRSKVTTPGNPAIQIDDQIQIVERMTNETYFHYVLGVSSDIDNEAGTWTYALDTHWLGADLDAAFVVKVDQLRQATRTYLSTLGAVD